MNRIMNLEPHQILTAVLAAAGPLSLLVLGMLPSGLLNRHCLRAARMAALNSLVALALACLADVCLVCFGRVDCKYTIAGPFGFGVYFDSLSAIMLTLVAFLLAVVTRFSVNYLAGDLNQGRFTKWLCLTGGSVLMLVISGNLIQFALAWSATSWFLHKLLVFYPDRPGAVLAARKKFLISRLGDVCLLAVLALVFNGFHSWEFSEIFAASRQIHETGVVPDHCEINAICLMLAVGAMLKSAQFPFHSWLPDTMETPTPVSALMHAGIINAGGFLVIRMNPLVTLSPAALSVLALFGAFTALFASLVMLTHASVKRSLAFSTVAQMGFMMLECGLGAFSLAVLHIVAHSLYKAHAFLSSGSIVRLAKSEWVPVEKPGAHPLTLVASFATAIALSLGCARVFSANWQHNSGLLVLGVAFSMALAYALWNFWSRFLNLTLAAFGVAFSGAIASAHFLLHKMFSGVLDAKDCVNSQADSPAGVLLLGALLVLFLAVLVLQTELPQWAGRPAFQALYVHARNGFYFNTLANRAVAALWPVKIAPKK